ncbi:hypothetical protein CN630_33925 [Bacillus wiedmannii]|uniref:hypothetical protein n=1 Tax=Bacillus wiedmannii TaxID=1890302 RepID=UPI000BF962DC|nr:hypothetical protein [Bacillus wiedmannii]PEN03510.1 hypothetical protein CN630_33925 [Bacillus wiedmannii]
MKQIISVLFTSLLAGAMLFVTSSPQIHAFVIVNNRGYINLDGRMGDGARTWNNEVSSATVKSK